MQNEQLKFLYQQLKELQEKHEKYKIELKEAIDQGDGLHDNQLWQMAQQKFNMNLDKMNLIQRQIREEEWKAKQNK